MEHQGAKGAANASATKNQENVGVDIAQRCHVTRKEQKGHGSNNRHRVISRDALNIGAASSHAHYGLSSGDSITNRSAAVASSIKPAPPPKKWNNCGPLDLY